MWLPTHLQVEIQGYISDSIDILMVCRNPDKYLPITTNWVIKMRMSTVMKCIKIIGPCFVTETLGLNVPKVSSFYETIAYKTRNMCNTTWTPYIRNNQSPTFIGSTDPSKCRYISNPYQYIKNQQLSLKIVCGCNVRYVSIPTVSIPTVSILTVLTPTDIYDDIYVSIPKVSIPKVSTPNDICDDIYVSIPSYISYILPMQIMFMQSNTHQLTAIHALCYSFILHIIIHTLWGEHILRNFVPSVALFLSFLGMVQEMVIKLSGIISPRNLIQHGQLLEGVI